MKFRLPQLQKLVSSNAKIDDNHSSKLITVFKGHAINMNSFAVCVDLREYVKIECSITEPNDLETLTTILEWMETKSFTKEFWKELTTECFVTLVENGLKLEYPNYEKVLIYEETNYDDDTFLQVIKDNLLASSVIQIEKVAIAGKHLELLNTTFKKEMSVDSFILEFSGRDKAVRFSGVRKPYIFGFITLSYEDSIEFTGFMNSLNFGRELETFLRS